MFPAVLPEHAAGHVKALLAQADNARRVRQARGVRRARRAKRARVSGHSLRATWALAGRVGASAGSLTAPVMLQADVIGGDATGAGGRSPDPGPTRSAALNGSLEGVTTSQKGISHA
jgi:hypothetical protein